jgi:3-deoxy-D-manno-octulosonic-acid transferase
MRFLYSLAVTFVLVAGLPFWLLQIALKPKYRAGLWERLGRVPARLRRTNANENCIWIHAVSVGEVLAIAGLVTAFKKKFPDWRVAVSTTTQTGQALARAKFGEENVSYLPLDLGIFLRPFFKALRPRALVLAESEFWPNLLSVANDEACRVAVVNARVSDRSFPRYMRFASLLGKHVFPKFDLLLAQGDIDAERLKQMGAPASRVQVGGNLKFDFTPPADIELVQRLKNATMGLKVFVCGSTVEGEEQLLLQALEEIASHGTVNVLAPRHPERFEEAAALLSQFGIAVVRRSTWKDEAIAPGTIFLLDSIGELAATYSLGDVAFVGGSMVPRGGHNILEPAYFAKAIVVGPYMENFRDIAQRFDAAGALLTVEPQNFAKTVNQLMSDDSRRAELGARARQVLDANKGATERTLSALEVLLWMPQTLRNSIARGKQ